MPSPRVSVFLAAYNHARFLPECLDSILAQTYRDFEIVVVDDGSGDDSHEILTDYQRRFSERIHYLWHPGHVRRGISASCNLALAHARGEYLAWIGSDDLWYPETLARQVARLDAYPDQGLVYGYAHFIDTSGNLLPGLYGVDISRDQNPIARMIQSCHPPAMTVMVRRECLERVGLFDETLVCSDWELWLRVLAHWKPGFVSEALARYRIHGRNVSKGIDPHLDLQRTLEVMLAVRSKAAAVGGGLMHPRNRALLDLQIAFLLFCSGREEEAIRNLHRAFEQDPTLSRDAEYFSEWLSAWKPDFYTVAHPQYGLWAIAHLPQDSSAAFRKRVTALLLASEDARSFFIKRGIETGLKQEKAGALDMIFDDCPQGIVLPRAWRAGIMREIYAALLFKTAESGNSSKTRYYWTKAVRHDPSWLLNRGVWSIAVRAFAARRT